MRRFLPFLVALSLTACLNLNVDSPTASNNPSDPATETFASSLNINIATMQKTASGVYYKDATVGTGDALTSQTKVVVSYLVLLKTGAAVGQSLSETMDLSTQLVGFKEGIVGMRVGGERILVVPSALAYGPRT
ncbi:MAG TPA: FKBP-type peptidyl-prolyl cis-trans isomerase, partial [Gemmatimonadaceae bacterium]|nr:FKBP-type peptidyl-prolyl cis-trans isomerase [Gemmatimonadaceae bacterium]